MNRAAMAGLVACAIGAAGFACSSNDPAQGGDDSGAIAPSDASVSDSGGIRLDARPSLPDTSAPATDASDAGGPIAPCVPFTPGAACGLDPQCGCSADQTCDLNGDDSVSCAVAGTALAGHACVSTASCATGLTCLGGACRAYCGTSGDAGCAAAGGPCLGLNGADGGPLANAGVCTFACALEDPNACGATGSIAAGCALLDVDAETTDCTLAGSVAAHGDCSAASCAPGLVCVTFGGATPTTECRQWCRVGQADCGDAGACQGFTDAVYAHGTQYGFCP